VRVVYVLGTAGGTWGGMERHTLDLAGALTDEHEVHVLADAGYRERIPAGVQFHTVAMARSRRHPLLWWQLRQTLRDLQPDVVHAQGAKAAQLLSAHAHGLSRLGAICVGTVHGTKSGHRAYASLDGVIVVSSDIAAQVNHGNKQVIANGVGSASVRPEVLAACRAERSRWSGPLVLAVGRLVQVKGYDLLLQAWPRDVGAHLLVLGDGLERAALQQQIEMLSLQDQVTLAGYSTAVPEWLTLADALVISSHREGFPYVLVEALQAGCPVLSTAVSGVSEVLPTGLLADPGSVTALQALLTRELPQLETLKARETELFARARSALSLAAMARETHTFYLSTRDLIHA
jgi:glycosyltransferase involved in cell wall biosynthesis